MGKPDDVILERSQIQREKYIDELYMRRRIRKGTAKPVEMTMRTMCTLAGLHTSDRLLLEAVRKVEVVRSHIRTFDFD